MAGFQQRFIGIAKPPRSLSQMDVDEAFPFRLSQKDIQDVRERFKSARLGAALQLVIIRAMGRSPDVCRS